MSNDQNVIRLTTMRVELCETPGNEQQHDETGA